MASGERTRTLNETGGRYATGTMDVNVYAVADKGKRHPGNRRRPVTGNADLRQWLISNRLVGEVEKGRSTLPRRPVNPRQIVFRYWPRVELGGPLLAGLDSE